jgi:hypothetical protein
VVCVGHLYGVALYYGTCGFTEHMHGVSYSRPEGLYYWGYYVGMNAPWVVVPGCEFSFSLSLSFFLSLWLFGCVCGSGIGLTWRVVLIWRSAGAIQRAFADAAAAAAVRDGQGKKNM